MPINQSCRCFVRQYSGVKVEEAGINLNGQLSLGENIADNGGVKTSFNVTHNLESYKEEDLGLQSMEKQHFGVGTSSTWIPEVHQRTNVLPSLCQRMLFK